MDLCKTVLTGHGLMSSTPSSVMILVTVLRESCSASPL